MNSDTTTITLYPWETGPMRDVVQQTTVRAITGPKGAPQTVWGYVLACGHTIEFPEPERYKCACTVCADEMRAAAAADARGAAA